MTYLSLFSGVGGFDLGFDRAGMQCVGQVEVDDKARAILARHWPEVPRHGDIREFDAKPFQGRVNVVCGGFPCQDLSVAGRRSGLAGERSGLWWEYHRVVSEVKPRLVVVENVPGLLSSNGGRDMEAVVRSLVELGYRVCWRVLDSQYFGVPQRRRRLFIVGSLGDGSSAEILFERESLCRDTPPSRKEGEGTACGIAGSLMASGAGTSRPAGICNELDFLTVAYSLTAREQGYYRGENANPIVIQDARDMDKGQNGKGWSEDGVSYTLLGAATQAVAFTQNQVGDVLTGDVCPAMGTNQNATGRNTPKVMSVRTDVTPKVGGDLGFTLTQPSPTGGGQPAAALVGAIVRRFMPLECERLQGFPDGWTSGQSDSARYRQIGNAVTVSVAEWIGRRILEAR